MRKEKLTNTILLSLVVMMLISTMSISAETYKQPEQRIVDIVDAPNPPQMALSPDGKKAIMVEYTTQLSLEDIAEPIAKLAGTRILTRYNIPRRQYYVTKMSLLDIKTGKITLVKTPKNGKFGYPGWSPDSKKFAAGLYQAPGSEVWVFDVKSASGKAVSPARINTFFLSPYTFTKDSKHIIVPLWLGNRGKAPVKPRVPTGPVIQETYGTVSKVITYTGLLKSSHDEELFKYYATSQLVRINIETKKIQKLNKPAIIKNIKLSPDEKYILVKKLTEPYSRVVPAYLFGYKEVVWTANGKTVKEIVDQPVADQLPIQGVRTGIRSLTWQKMKPATLVWAEALDGGNPNNKAEFRDVIKALPAPFKGQAKEIIQLPMRYAGIDWLNKTDLTVIWDYDRDKKWITARIVDFSKKNIASEAKLLFSRNYNDQYRNEGDFVYEKNKNNETTAILEDNEWVYLEGRGATPEGYRPFLHRFNIKTGIKQKIFTAGSDALEIFDAFANKKHTAFITASEDAKHPRNYFLREIKDGKAQVGRALTNFQPPSPELNNVRKELVKYTRNDGIPLSGTLYYPIGYKKGQKYPTVIWAYPREYTDAKTAGQVRTANNKYARIAGDSILFFVLRGYAVLNRAEIPIVGDPLTANDTFIEQLTAGAQAAVDKLVEMGISDPNRIGAAGHSYGAFMVAHLLAHTDLFAAGIARSGAYNRTLTPFGFQGERRTFWEAKDIYMKLSPFTHANKIDEPLLMIHGEDDPNPGTYPIQSKRLFAAIKGTGGTAKLVLLPYEEHGYEARESNLHVLAEMFNWFDKYLKNAKAKPAPKAKPVSKTKIGAKSKAEPKTKKKSEPKAKSKPKTKTKKK